MARKIHVDRGTAQSHEDKLVKSGVLRFVAVIDQDRVSHFSIHALVEVTFARDADAGLCVQDVLAQVDRPELREAMVLIGDVDSQIRVRAKDISQLREIVMAIRRSDVVRGTTTRIIAGSWHHAEKDATEARF